MKIRNSILFVSLLCSCSAFAQRSILDFGAEGGAGQSSLRGNAILNNYHDPRIGATGGIFMQYNFKKVLSVRTGFYYQNKGSSIQTMYTDIFGNTMGKVKGSENFYYLTVPVLLRAGFGEVFRFSLNAGPYLDFLMRQTQSYTGTGNYPSRTTDNTVNFKRTDLGVAFGMGVSYTLFHRFAFSLEVRDYLGLTNVSAIRVYDNGSFKNNSITCLLGFSYRILARS